LVSGRGDDSSPVDRTLAERGLSRRVGVVVPNFGMVPELRANTDMIAMLPSRCIPEDTSSLAAFTPPIPVAGFPLHIAWHKRRQEDRGVQYVVEQLVRIMMEKKIGSTGLS